MSRFKAISGIDLTTKVRGRPGLSIGEAALEAAELAALLNCSVTLIFNDLELVVFAGEIGEAAHDAVRQYNALTGPPFDPATIESFGLYRLFWRQGGYSLACVGGLNSGTRWFACSNWEGANVGYVATTDWSGVLYVELVEAQ